MIVSRGLDTIVQSHITSGTFDIARIPLIPASNVEYNGDFVSTALDTINSNYGNLIDKITNLQTLLNAKAPLANPNFTGTPTILTKSIATQDYVQTNLTDRLGTSSFREINHSDYINPSFTRQDNIMYIVLEDPQV